MEIIVEPLAKRARTAGSRYPEALMSILVDSTTKVICQGITGASGADDQAALSDAQTVGEKQDACGKKAPGLSGVNRESSPSASTHIWA